VAQNWQNSTGIRRFLFTDTRRLFELWKTPTIAQSLEPEDKLAVIVTLAGQVDLKKIGDKDKSKPGTTIVTARKDKAKISHKDILEVLRQCNLKKRVTFWDFNGPGVAAAKEVICEIVNQPGVANIGMDDTPVRADAGPCVPTDNGCGLIDVMQACAFLDQNPPDQSIDSDSSGKGGGKRNSN
jgi:hypothetical protein